MEIFKLRFKEYHFSGLVSEQSIHHFENPYFRSSEAKKLCKSEARADF